MTPTPEPERGKSQEVKYVTCPDCLRKEIERLEAENKKLKSINPDCGGTHILTA